MPNEPSTICAANPAAATPSRSCQFSLSVTEEISLATALPTLATTSHAQPRTAPHIVVRTIAKHTMKTGFQRSVSGLLLKTKTADTDGHGKLGRDEGLD